VPAGAQEAAIAALQGEGSVVPGLEDAVVGMRQGSKRRILVPPQLGYQTNPDLQPQVGRILRSGWVIRAGVYAWEDRVHARAP
jgi:hypothetical protein